MKQALAQTVAAEVQPRGLRRAQAAAYLGIGPTLFDELVREGTLPPPKTLKGAVVWDRRELDIYFEAVPVQGARRKGRPPDA